MLFAPGMQIGKYVLRRKIGVGGYGFVFSGSEKK